MDNYLAAVILFVSVILLIAAIIASFLKYGNKLQDYLKRITLTNVLVHIIQAYVLLLCAVILSLTSATFIFYYVFPYAGRVIPLVYIMGMFLVLSAAGIIILNPKKVFVSLFTQESGDRKASIRKLITFNTALILITILLSMVAVVSGRLECEAVIKQIHGKGLPVSFQDLVTPEPSGKNAAFRLEELEHSLSGDNAPMNANEFKDTGYPDIYRVDKWTAGQKRIIRELLKKNKYLGEFKNIIQETDYYRYNTYHNVTVNPMDIDYPEMGYISRFCNQMSLEAGLYIIEGRYTDALHINTIIAKTAMYLASQDTAFAKMVSLSCARYGINIIYNLINIRGVSEAQINDAASLYDFIIERDLVKEGMKHELVLGVELYRWIRTGGLLINSRNSDIFALLFEAAGLYLYSFPADFKVKAGMVLGDFTPERESGKLSIWPNLFTALSVPGCFNMFDSQAEYRFRLKLFKILRSANNYYAKKGKYPASPEELLAFNLDKADIIDPLSDEGSPIKFKQTDDGLIIYSIGRDKTDDNGDLKRDAGAVLWKNYGAKP